MPVDISDILHVLAHELRTPVGIAHGYLRLLLEDRLGDAGDRRRALEQTQKALARLSDLGNETTELASWYEQGPAEDRRAALREVIGIVAAFDYEWPVRLSAPEIAEHVVVRTSDGPALGRALSGVVGATARELRGDACMVSFTVTGDRLEMLAGPAGQLEALGGGPGAPGAGPLPLERGGLGLTLIHAAVILDAHGVERWTMNGSRQLAGIRVPIEVRP